MIRRILTSLAMAPLLIGAIIYPNPFLFQLLCWLCLGVALLEYFNLTWSKYPLWQRYFGALLGMVCSALWIMGVNQYISGVTLTSLLVGIAFLFFVFQGQSEEAHNRLGHLVFGVLYVAGLGTHVALMRGLDHGVFWIFVTLAATWLNDTGAYFAGHKWGRHRLAPAISPGKTWEGWVGGILGSAAGVYALWYLLPNPFTAQQLAVLIPLAAIFGPLGDLSESLLKRSTGFKDSGHVIPGHGGMLDRIDALLFVAPLFYYYALYLSRPV